MLPGESVRPAAKVSRGIGRTPRRTAADESARPGAGRPPGRSSPDVGFESLIASANPSTRLLVEQHAGRARGHPAGRPFPPPRRGRRQSPGNRTPAPRPGRCRSPLRRGRAAPGSGGSDRGSTSSDCQPRNVTSAPARARSRRSSWPLPMTTSSRPSRRQAVDRQVDPLVRGERRHHQVVILARHRRRAVEIGVDRRIDDDALAAVALADAVLDRLADGDEMRHPVGGRAVPAAKPRQESAGQPSPPAGRAAPK